jgi:hypothetical protein
MIIRPLIELTGHCNCRSERELCIDRPATMPCNFGLLRPFGLLLLFVCAQQIGGATLDIVFDNVLLGQFRITVDSVPWLRSAPLWVRYGGQMLVGLTFV